MANVTLQLNPQNDHIDILVLCALLAASAGTDGSSSVRHAARRWYYSRLCLHQGSSCSVGLRIAAVADAAVRAAATKSRISGQLIVWSCVVSCNIAGTWQLCLDSVVPRGMIIHIQPAHCICEKIQHNMACSQDAYHTSKLPSYYDAIPACAR